MGFNAKDWFSVLKREIKREILEYYDTVFSRKSGPPLCIALCVLTIISFVAHMLGIA